MVEKLSKYKDISIEIDKMWHTKTEVVSVAIERTRKVNPSPSEQQTPGSLKDSTPGNNAHPARSTIQLVMRKKHPLSALGLWFVQALKEETDEA